MPGLSGIGGLGAAYGGFQQAESTDQDIQKKQLGNQEAMTDVAGQQAFGKALQLLFQGSSQGGAPPQPPMPGQPSMPQGGPPGQQPGMPPGGPMPGGPPPGGMQPPGMGQPQGSPPGMPPPGGQPPMPGPGGPMPPQGGPPGGQPPGGQQPPGMQQGKPSLDLQSIIGAIVKSNPGAPPQVIAAAVNRFVPLMNAQAQQQWKELSLQLREQAIMQSEKYKGIAAEQRGQALDQGQQRADTGRQESERKREQVDKRLQQGDKRIDLETQRLEQQKLQKQITTDMKMKQFQAQLDQAQARKDAAQTRNILQAMHLRAAELISAWGAGAKIDPKMLNDILEENRKVFREQVDKMPGTFNDRFQGGTPNAPGQ